MTAKVFTLTTQPGVQRDGTLFEKTSYNDGRWVRFQRDRPRKILGYRVISNQLFGPSRGIWVNAQNNYTTIFSGYSDGLQSLTIDNNGVGAGIADFTLSNFTASDLNLWQFDGVYSVTGEISNLLAHPGQNLSAIDENNNTPVLIGDITGSSMSQIGVFIVNVTSNNTTTITLAAADVRIGAGQTVTGTGIPANTTVVSVSGVSVVLSNTSTTIGALAVTFNNNVSVSGGVVSIHPYVFVYGNSGLIRNCSAGAPDDWMSADANETNVSSGKVVQGLPVRGGSNSPSGLFWTIDSLVRVSFIGGTGTPAQYWRYDIITSQSSILSSQCVIEYDGIYYWVGVDRFMLYNGTVKELPNSMNQNYFFDNLNYNQRQKVWATKVPRYGEIWWFYPRGDSTECNDAVIYNVRENIWYDAGEALGTRRSAGYFSQVFAFPIAASTETLPEEVIFSDTFNEVSGSEFLYLDTYNVQVAIRQSVTGVDIPDDTTVVTITSSNIKTLGSVTGGSGYTNGTYLNVPLTGGFGQSAEATVTVAGGAVTTVVITHRGAGYEVPDALSADDSDLGGGGGTGFSVPVSAIYAQAIEMSNAATGTGAQVLTFSLPPNRIQVLQHEIGVDAIDGQNVSAIESYFETNDIGWVSGGPSQQSPEGANRWFRIERVEPDFVLNGTMDLIVTGRPYAQSQDQESAPYTFDGNTNKIDMKEQRRELRIRFVSNVVGGDYQTGRVLISADVGDVRGY